MTPQPITVSEFLAIINETLGFAYPEVTIEGEVSSFKVNQGKFVFFDLKDEQNVLSCFMMVHQLKLPIEDGMKIRVTGAPKVTRFSKFSLTVRSIELAGEGELRRAMEMLKQKLSSEGLFAESRKRPLPRFPRRIGLITSGTSAAYSDFIKILGARWGGLEILLADVSVQGLQAPDQIVGALEYFNQLEQPVDVLVIIRGGGSLEDLIAFSTEPVARAVASSRTPTIVGVGHEIDFSLADYAADVRAATPTDAARLVVPDRTEMRVRVLQLQERAQVSLQTVLTDRYRRIDGQLNQLERYLRQPRERVERAQSSLQLGLQRLDTTRRRYEQSASTLSQRLVLAQQSQLRRSHDSLAALSRLLKGYDPQAALARGYAIVRHNGEILRDPASVKSGEPIVVQLAKGKLDAEVR